MANEFDLTKGDGLFKDVYAKRAAEVRGKSAILQRLHKFSQEAKVGDEYKINVPLKVPQGWTHLGTTTTVTALKGVRNAVHVQAATKSYEAILREQVKWKVFSQATSSGPEAFKSAMDAVVEGMQLSCVNRQEAILLHGQRGLGTVESVADGGSSTVVITMTAASWSTGLWYSALGATVDAVTSGTTVNNDGGVMIVTKVDPANRAITCSHSGTFSDQVAANDVMNFEGLGITATPLDPVGLLAQAGNTSSSVFGINPTTAGYGNWAGNTYDAAGPLDWEKLEDAMHRVRARAGMDVGKLHCLVGRGYSSLVKSLHEAGHFEIGNASKDVTAGVKGINYDAGADLGEFSIIFHPLMKDGELVIYPKEETIRAGATDITFNLPGAGEKFFQFVNGYDAVELGALFDIFLMVKKPSAALLMTGITY